MRDEQGKASGDGKVVLAFGSATEVPDCPIKLTNSSPVFHCRHGQLEIDVHERSIRCAECGATLDAFDYLAVQGGELNFMWQRYREVKQSIHRLNESVDRLTREEKRLKASIRRNKEKLPVLDVRREP